MTSLGHCIQILSGFAFKSANFGEDGELPVVRIRDVERGYSNTFYSGSHDRRYEINNGDLLVGMDGNFNCAYWKGGKALLNQRVCKLIADPVILDESYLYYMLGPELKRIEDKTPFATVKHLSVKRIKSIEMNLPPLQEQKRIAAILDQAEELKQKRQRTLDLLEELKQSIFIDMFGDPFTNLKGFPVKSISSFGSVITGNTPSRQIAQNYGDHIEWIKSNNITPINIYVTKAEEFLSAKGASVGRVVPTGSILVTCIAGSRNSIGNVALTDRSVAFNQQINALLPNDPADTYFLFQQLYLNKELVREQSSGGMKGLVNKTNFSSIKLLDPPEQLKAEYNRKFQRLNLLAEQFKNSDTIINELFNSLQHKAFSGELSGAA